jgi:hypothetical protein
LGRGGLPLSYNSTIGVVAHSYANGVLSKKQIFPVIPLSRYPDILGKVGGFIFSEENRYVPFSQFSLYFSPFLFF